jgi:hypothetical protein
LALLTPDEMQALEGIRSVDRSDRQKRPNLLIESAQDVGLEQKAVPPRGVYIPLKIIELFLEKGLKSKLNAKDRSGKTALDWAIERRCIALEKSQKSESDLKIIAEYKDVIEVLLFKDIPYSEENKTIYSKITEWEENAPASLRRHFPRPLLQELRQWRQKLEESRLKTGKNI